MSATWRASVETTSWPRGRNFVELDRLVEEAAGIVAQVNDEPLEARLFHLANRALQFIGGFLAELAEFHIADLVLVERVFALAVDVPDTGDLDDVPGELDFLLLLIGGAEDGDGDIGAGLAAQAADGVVEVELLGGLAVDLDNAVAGSEAGLAGGRELHGLRDGEDHALAGTVGADAQDDAHAAERTLGVLAHVVVFAGLHELAVRVQRADHALERGVDELLVGDLSAIDVVLPDGFQHAGEQLNVLVGVFLGGGLGVREIEPRAEEEVQAEHGHKQAKEKASLHKTVVRK